MYHKTHSNGPGFVTNPVTSSILELCRIMQCNVVVMEIHRIHGTDSSSSVHFTRLAKQKKTKTNTFHPPPTPFSFFFQLFPWGSSVFPTLRFPPVFPVFLSLSSFEGSDRRFWCFLFSNCHGRRSYLASSNRSLSYEKHPTEKHHRIH